MYLWGININNKGIMEKILIREIVDKLKMDVYQDGEFIGSIYNDLQLNDIKCQVKKFKLENVQIKWIENNKDFIANLNNRGRIIDNHPPLNIWNEQINFLIGLDNDYNL